jgi:hypothetical protein
MPAACSRYRKSEHSASKAGGNERVCNELGRLRRVHPLVASIGEVDLFCRLALALELRFTFRADVAETRPVAAPPRRSSLRRMDSVMAIVH